MSSGDAELRALGISHFTVPRVQRPRRLVPRDWICRVQECKCEAVELWFLCSVAMLAQEVMIPSFVFFPNGPTAIDLFADSLKGLKRSKDMYCEDTRRMCASSPHHRWLVKCHDCVARLRAARLI